MVLRDETARAAGVQAANLVPTDWSPDGRSILFPVPGTASGIDLWLLPLSDRKWQVSINGGYEPRGRADGREIYYLSDARKPMGAPDAGAFGCRGQPHALRLQPRWPAIPSQQAERRRLAHAHYRGHELDGGVEKAGLQRFTTSSVTAMLNPGSSADSSISVP